MRDNWNKVGALVLQSEGGYVDHPKDPGGATNLGITLATLKRFRMRSTSKEDVRALRREEALEIYKKFYWDPIHGDDLPRGLDYAVMDFCVNSGQAQAVKTLQRVLGVHTDGALGPETLEACRGVPSMSGLINGYMDARLEFLRRLKTWPTFGRGWSKRVGQVRVNALSLVRRDVNAPLPVASGGEAKADPKDTALTSTRTGKANTLAMVGSIGAGVSEVAGTLSEFSYLKWVSIAMVVLAVVGAGIALYLKLNQIEEGVAQ